MEDLPSTGLDRLEKLTRTLRKAACSDWPNERVAEMLIVETIGRIRRERFVKGKAIREIARDLGMSRNTVRRHSTIGYVSPIEFERKVGFA